MPKGPIFNSAGSAEGDSGGPREWQVHYALQRVRDHHMHHASASELHDALTAQAAPGAAADPDMVDLEIFFAHRGPQAPAMAAMAAMATVGLRVMGDGSRPEQQRRQGAQALLELDRDKYYLQVVDFAATLPRAGQLLGLLARRPAHVKGPDARIMRNELTHLEALSAANPKSPHEAYFLATAIGDYAGERFTPAHPERYQGSSGLTDAYFFETVQNALSWWRAHKGSLTP
jgi:hypothetical protein